MNKRIHTLLILGGLLFTASACDDQKPVDGGALIDQVAELCTVRDSQTAKVSPYRATSFVLADPENLATSTTLSVTLYKPAEKELTASVTYDEAAARDYIAREGGAFELLPADALSFPAQTTVAKGALHSQPIVVQIKGSESMEGNKPYVFALKLKSVSGSKVADEADVAIYTVSRYERIISIDKVVRLTRDVYLQPTKEFNSVGGDFTMETLLYVEKFRSDADPGEAQISTLMGIEGGTLLRFGDSSVPGNQLQAAGVHIHYTFEPNRWYHIALVSNAGTVKVYVNGAEVISFNKSAYLYGGNTWYIGRSWSDGRGIQARLAETRIWSVPRTAAQLQDNMYEVTPSTEGLEAYWKMNAASGATITDITGHGHDLTQRLQPGRGLKDVVVMELDDSVTIE